MFESGMDEAADAPPGLVARVGWSYLCTLLAVALLLAVNVHTSRGYLDAAQWVDHAHQVMHQIDRTKASTYLVELGTQAYRLTGDPGRLAERNVAFGQRVEAVSALQKLASSPAQQDQLRQLRAVLAERAGISHRIEALVGTAGPAAANAYAAQAPLRETFQRMVQVLDDMATAEQDMLAGRLAQQQRLRNQGLLAGALLAGTLALLLAKSYQLIRFHVRRDTQRGHERLAQGAAEHASQLLEGELRYRAAFMTNPDPMILNEFPGGKLLDVNHGFVEAAGWPAAEALGQSADQLGLWHCAEEHARFINLMIREQRCEHFAAQLRTRGGSVLQVRLSAAVFHVGTQAYLITAVRDMTQVTRMAKALDASEQEFQLLANLIPQIVWITRADGWNVYFNQQWTEYTGLTLEESLGEGWIKPFHPDDQSMAWEAWHRAVSGRSSYRVECRLRRHDGQYFWWLIRATPVLDAQGGIEKWFGTCTDVNEIKRAAADIEQLAHFDQLTGLANRTLLKAHFAHDLGVAQRRGEPLIVMFIDLDHFKDINDTLGHSVGDRVLVEVARRLKAVVRDQDTLTRQGGDEFILVLPGTDAVGAARVASKLIEVIARPCLVDQHDLVITPSIGIAVYPDDGTSLELLSKNADTAMYRAKREGRNGFCFYTPTMQAQSARNLALANALRYAMLRREFTLHYQAQFSLDGLRLVGVEALLRWHHPELGDVPPAEFIPVAEVSGQIMGIGEWVLRAAMRQLKQWHANGVGPRSVAVNLSPVQFRHGHLTSLITRILDEEQVPPECLELELTEAAAMDNPQAAMATMDALHGMGIRLTIDDFGTGYSSLSYHKQFKVYKLKIDRSFVRDIPADPENQAIVSAIVSMAHDLGLRTIAEGVETTSQLEFLRKQACDEAQGPHFCNAMPAAQFEELIRALQRRETGLPQAGLVEAPAAPGRRALPARS